MRLFFSLTAANLLAFSQTWCYLLFPSPFLKCKEDAFVNLHLPGKALCRLPSEYCACYHWGKAGALLQFLRQGGTPTCASASPAVLPHFSLNPLPAHSSAMALKSFQSTNHFCHILTNLSLSLVCEQSHSGG